MKYRHLKDENESLRAQERSRQNERVSGKASLLVMQLAKLQASQLDGLDFYNLMQAMEGYELIRGLLSDMRGQTSCDWSFQAQEARGLCTICRAPFVHTTHSVTCEHVDSDVHKHACRECTEAYSPIDWWQANPGVESWCNAGKTCERPANEQQDFQRRQLRDVVLTFTQSDSRYVDRIKYHAGEWLHNLGAELR